MRDTPGSARSFFGKISSFKEYLSHIGIPYIDALLENINSRFSDSVVKLIVATSIFNPAQLPAEESLSSYGLQDIQELADFYGNKASIEYLNEHTSLPLLNREELISEWKIFRLALYNEKEKLVRFKNSTPSTQQVLASMQSSDSYKCIFLLSFKILNIILSIPVGTATVGRSFSQIEMTKTRLRNRLSDVNLSRLKLDLARTQFCVI